MKFNTLTARGIRQEKVNPPGQYSGSLAGNGRTDLPGDFSIKPRKNMITAARQVRMVKVKSPTRLVQRPSGARRKDELGGSCGVLVKLSYSRPIEDIKTHRTSL